MKAYRVFAYLIALEVLVQSAAITFAMFGFGKWIDNGHTANKATFEDGHMNFSGAPGFTIHGVNGSLFIPLIAIAFLILSFFTKSVPAGRKWAGIVFGLVALQVFLGFMSHVTYAVAPLHGINAFVLFLAALRAGRAATPSAAAALAAA